MQIHNVNLSLSFIKLLFLFAKTAACVQVKLQGSLFQFALTSWRNQEFGVHKLKSNVDVADLSHQEVLLKGTS